MRPGRDSWFLISLVVVFAAVTLSASLGGFEREQRTHPTTYSSGPQGLRALMQLLEKQGFHTDRSEKPFHAVGPAASLVILAEPIRRPVSEKEAAALGEWLDGGGTLLVLSSAKREEENALPYLAEGIGPGEDGPAAILQRKSSTLPGFLRGVETLSVSKGARLDIDANDAVSILLKDDANRPLLAEKKVGDGKLVVAAEALSLSNKTLGASDNSVLWVQLVRHYAGPKGGHVHFDEYHQGFGVDWGSSGSLWQESGPVARHTAFYGLFLLLVFVYCGNRTFGPKRTLQVRRDRPSTEYVVSMAGLYRRAGAASVAVQHLYQAARRRLTTRFALAPDAADSEIAQKAAAVFGDSMAGLSGILDRCGAIAAGGKTSEAELAQLARRLHEYGRTAQRDERL